MLNEKLIHSFNNHLWNTYYVASTVPDDMDIMVNKKNLHQVLKELIKDFWSLFFPISPVKATLTSRYQFSLHPRFTIK